MRRFRSRCLQAMSARRTDVRGSSWSRGEYATPAASRSGTSNNGTRDGTNEYATKGRDSLYSWARRWPTVTASMAQHGTPMRGKNAQGGPSLGEVARLWPTALASPNANRSRSMRGRQGETLSAMAQWATATATDAKRSGAAGYSTESGRHSGTTLTDQAVRGHGHPPPETPTDGETTSQPADLNQQFVETLMGFPPGWLT